MRTCMYCCVSTLLLASSLLSQPGRFLDELPPEAREPLDSLYALVVEGQMWDGGLFTEELLLKIESIFEALNPRDGEWGLLDGAITSVSYAAHDFFDTLEIVLGLTVRDKTGSGSGVLLIEFEKPKRATPGTQYILSKGNQREALVTLRTVLVLNLVLRITRGMHSILS